MPRGDRSGPNGMGPMTGRAAGYCAGFNGPGYANAAFAGGRGLGRGRGFGRGLGRGFGRWGGGYNPGPAYEAPSRENELNTLKSQQEYLDSSLKEVQRRIEEIEKADQ